MATSPRFLAILVLGSLAACQPRSARVTPAPTPEATVEQFIAAVNANDQDRMERLYGDATGNPHWQSQTNRHERLAIFQKLLQCDSVRVLGVEADTSGHPELRLKLVRVELVRGDRRARLPFAVSEQFKGGWLVYGFDFTPLMPAPVGRRNP